jgi:hypothetical protein
MRRVVLALAVLALAFIACRKATPCELDPSQCPSPTPAASTRAPLPTPTAERVTATFTPMIPVIVQTAIVRQVSVNVRDAANGDPTGEYVYSGDEVVILEIDGDWVRIQEPAGWVFIGCLENLSERGCIAE